MTKASGGKQMEFLDLLPYFVAVITGVGSWLGSYFMATKKSKQELKSLEESNKHEIEKLMKRHEVNIESLKEKHLLEMDKRSDEHEKKIEIMGLEHQNELLRKSQELENSVKFNAMGEMFSSPEKIKGLLDLIEDPKLKPFMKK